MTLVADSGALYALYDADDSHHAAVRQVLETERGPIIIPTAILAEVDYLLREFLGIDAELEFLRGITDGAYTLESLTPVDLVRCQELISLYRDLDLGLADSCVIATAERLGIKHVLTVDERDFRAVKPAIGSFVLLPADA